MINFSRSIIAAASFVFGLILVLLFWSNHRSEKTLGKNDSSPSRTVPADRQPEVAKSLAMSDSDADDLTHFQVHSDLPEGYVGTLSCAECHPSQFRSYQTTDHSRSLSLWSADDSTPLSQFTHAESNTVYTALRQSGKLYHRESLIVAAGDEDPLTPTRLVTAELPVQYVMGSGAFAQSYLMRDGEYLLQSPMTWYVGPQEYAMAPGFAGRHHLGMTRVVTDRCLFCHAGNLTRRDGNDETVSIAETAIGCERCHGPGQDHADLYRNDEKFGISATQAPPDTRIIHPGRLSRNAADALCAQCHLQGDIDVELPGRSAWDFRPGERLDAVKVSYKIDTPGEPEKTFVDHFDQMWQSQCYLQSDSLKCISCHDPHHTATPNDRERLHRRYCAQCHQDADCGIPLDQRMEPHQNRCVACHMPKTKSEIAHAATTNHRIGIHFDRSASVPTHEVKPQFEAQVSDAVATLGEARIRLLRNPLDDTQPNSPLRNKLLAQATWFMNQVRTDSDGDFLSHSRSFSPLAELTELAKRAPDDLRVLVAIASLAKEEAEWLSNQAAEGSELRAQQMWRFASTYAERAALKETQPTDERKTLLDVLFAARYASEQYSQAERIASELVAIRRSARDQYNLGLSLGRLRRFSEAEQAFGEAIRIDGRYLLPYLSLIKIYQQVDPVAAEQLRQTAAAIQSHLTSETKSRPPLP